MDQSEKMPIPYSKVYEYINEFLEECRNANGTKQISHRVDVIDLKSGTNIILDNGIIAKGCTWSKNEWNNKTHKYERFDRKYIDIQKNSDYLIQKIFYGLNLLKTGILGLYLKDKI